MIPLRRSASSNARVVRARQIHEPRVQERGVLALEQADARRGDGTASPRRQGIPRGGSPPPAPRRRDRAARTPRRRRPRAGRARGYRGRSAASRRVEGHDGPAIVLVAAAEHEDLAPDERGEVAGPIDEGRKGGAGGEPDADGGDGRQIAALNDGVGEVGGADHHGVDRAPSQPRRLHELAERALRCPSSRPRWSGS